MGKRQKTRATDYGLFQPHQRLNVDQIPFELDNQARRSYVPHQESSMVQISGPSDGSKRFGTLQMTVHPGFPIPQPKLGMFFKGAGEVYKFEKDAYHPSVDVYFSDKAWLTKKLAKEYVGRTLKDWTTVHIGPEEKFRLFQDNLGTQKDLTIGCCIDSPVSQFLRFPSGRSPIKS